MTLHDEEAVETIRVHYTLGEYEDSLVLTGTITELREQAPREVAKRGGTNPWSESVR